MCSCCMSGIGSANMRFVCLCKRVYISEYKYIPVYIYNEVTVQDEQLLHVKNRQREDINICICVYM